MADNLAAFPYQVVDEPLFVIHKINIIVSVSGSNVLQSYREVKILKRESKIIPREARQTHDIVFDKSLLLQCGGIHAHYVPLVSIKASFGHRHFWCLMSNRFFPLTSSMKKQGKRRRSDMMT